jgi:hypothetical protein
VRGAIKQHAQRLAVTCAAAAILYGVWRVRPQLPPPCVKCAPSASYLPQFNGEMMEGVSWDYKTTIRVPWDKADTTGTIYLCWKTLKAAAPECGQCIVYEHDETIGAGRSGGLEAKPWARGCSLNTQRRPT